MLDAKYQTLFQVGNVTIVEDRLAVNDRDTFKRVAEDLRQELNLNKQTIRKLDQVLDRYNIRRAVDLETRLSLLCDKLLELEAKLAERKETIETLIRLEAARKSSDVPPCPGPEPDDVKVVAAFAQDLPSDS